MSGRSQIAEALFKKQFGNTHEVSSAGTSLSGPEQPIGELTPQIKEVLGVMEEEGLDVAMSVRKQLTEEMVKEADMVVVIMEDAEALPEYLSRSKKLVRWNIPDPKGKDLEFTRGVKNQIRGMVHAMRNKFMVS